MKVFLVCVMLALCLSCAFAQPSSAESSEVPPECGVACLKYSQWETSCKSYCYDWITMAMNEDCADRCTQMSHVETCQDLCEEKYELITEFCQTYCNPIDTACQARCFQDTFKYQTANDLPQGMK